MFQIATEYGKFSALKGIAGAKKKGTDGDGWGFELDTGSDGLGVSGTDHRPRASIFGFS